MNKKIKELIEKNRARNLGQTSNAPQNWAGAMGKIIITTKLPRKFNPNLKKIVSFRISRPNLEELELCPNKSQTINEALTKHFKLLKYEN